SRRARRQEPERAGEREREKAKREYAAERRVALQRPTDRCVAERKPGKTAQDPGAQPLEESPRRGDQQARADEGMRGNARLQPAGPGREGRDQRADDERGEA